MSVLVVVQEAMDIALHIASDEGWELASTYRDAFVVLARHGIIADDLAVSLGGAAQLQESDRARLRVRRRREALERGCRWASLRSASWVAR